MEKKKNAAQAQTQHGASNDTSNATTRQPPCVTGQCAEVLAILIQYKQVLSFVLTADYAIPEAAARIHDLRARGYNILTVIEPVIIYRGKVRRRVARYVLAAPVWPRPGFFADEGNAA